MLVPIVARPLDGAVDANELKLNTTPGLLEGTTVESLFPTLLALSVEMFVENVLLTVVAALETGADGLFVTGTELFPVAETENVFLPIVAIPLNAAELKLKTVVGKLVRVVNEADAPEVLSTAPVEMFVDKQSLTLVVTLETDADILFVLPLPGAEAAILVPTEKSVLGVAPRFKLSNITDEPDVALLCDTPKELILKE